MKRLRISAISYLNTAPLMWDFEHGTVGSLFDIAYTLPSQCAANLQAGSADVGIIPAAAYASNPNLAILPGVAIASLKAVRSILLISKGPLTEIETVALDTSSLTSVALTKVLFANCWGGARTYVGMKPDVEQMLSHHDAALIIGDPALQIDRSRYITHDLAEEWNRWTGKPFVFAFWAVRQAALQDAPKNLDLAEIFQQSRDHGLLPQNIDRIAEEWSHRLALSNADCKSYLKDSIYYFLDADCVAGLRLFYQYAKECNALPAVQSLYFLDAVKAAVS